MSALPSTGVHDGPVMSKLSPNVRRFGILWLSVIAAVVVLLAVEGRSAQVAQVVGNVGFLSALVFCLIACIRAARPRTAARRGWVLMAIAMSVGALGQASYVWLAVTGGVVVASETADTIAFLGYAIPSLAAIFAFPIPPDPLISRFRRVLDVLVITAGTVLISEATVLSAVRASVDMSTVDGLLKLAYPISDIAICAVVLTLGMRQLPGDRLTWLFLGGGLVTIAVTDSVYVRLLAEGQANLTATPLVAGWMAAPALIGIATLIPMTRHASRGRDFTLALQLVPYVPVLGAMIVLGLGDPSADSFLLVGGVVLLVAVTLRQVMIVYENVTLTRDLEAKVAARTVELTTLGSIVTSSSDAIVGISLDNVITAWNPAAERLYGYRAPDVIGKPPAFLPPDALEGVAGLLESAQDGQQLSAFELEWPRPDGSSVPVAMTVSPIVDQEGVKGISVSGQDITERKRAAEALEKAREEALESSRLKSEFLATMSHEIRTPMNGVIGLTALLLETPLDDIQRQYADGVRGAGEALLSVINDILDFSKLEAGKVVLDPVDFDPRRLVEDIGALLAPAAAAKQLELIAYCMPDVPHALVGDPGRIRQILLNLASNAVKFTPSGEVAVKVKRAHLDADSARLRFEVTDTGIGIAEKDRHRLFQSFSQADASTTRRFGGTGLGLAISQRLVEVMEGAIGMDSELGVGSSFWFEIDLPLGATPLVAPEHLSHDMLNDLRILVVDDNATNRMILEAQLTSWNMRPVLCDNATTALERLLEGAASGEPYDLAVLDMLMPDVDGMQLARTVTADERLTGLPMMMLTSSLQPAAAVLEEAGIGQWMNKPVKSSELYDRLVRLMAPREYELNVRKARSHHVEAGLPGSLGRILVVEDNSLNQMVAEGVLDRLGYEVLSVENGQVALEVLSEQSFSAVLMDCHMPTMDGFAATVEIRLREARADAEDRLPVIAMTAGAMAEDRERCLRSGMDDYISKPVDFAALEALLHRWATTPIGPLPATPLRAQVGEPADGGSRRLRGGPRQTPKNPPGWTPRGLGPTPTGRSKTGKSSALPRIRSSAAGSLIWPSWRHPTAQACWWPWSRRSCGGATTGWTRSGWPRPAATPSPWPQRHTN